jgi:hypothetical protein
MKSLLLVVAAALLGIVAGVSFSFWRFGLPSSGDPFDLSVLNKVSSEGLPTPPAPTVGQPRVLATPKDRRPSEAPGLVDPRSDELVYNFGVMPQHASSRAEFIFRNVGDETLVLRVGKSTCQCTVGELARSQVAPNEETVVVLSWKTEGPEGPFRHRAEIETNDPARPVVRLVVNGTLTRGLAIEPRDLRLGRISVRDGKQAEFNVVAFQATDLEIQKCELLDPGGATSGDPLAKLAEFSHRKLTPDELKSVEPMAKSGYRVTISLKPGLPLGRIDRKIRVSTNVVEPMEMAVSGLVAGDLSVAEVGAWSAHNQLFNLGETQSDQGASKSLFLIVGGADFQNVKVEVKRTVPSALQAKVGKPLVGAETARWPITISVPPGTPAMSHADKGEYGQVVLETTHPEQKEFVIDVSFLVTPAR